jgi:tetratricopeptide (TPR) repeat protein
VQRPFETIQHLINAQEFDRAKSMIAATRENLPANQLHQLTALSAELEMKAGNFSRAVELIRQATQEEPTWPPHWFWLCEFLMDGELWFEALEAADELISLSERTGDPYFLDDARFRKAFCLKALGRQNEIGTLKRKIPSDIQVFIGDQLYALADLE